MNTSPGLQQMLRSSRAMLASGDEQLALCAAAQAGDRNARNRLVAMNLPFVFKLARKAAPMANGALDIDDLVTEGAFGLLHAIEKFDASAGTKFLTYASWWAKQAIQRAIQDKAHGVRLPVHIQDRRAKVRHAQRRLWHRGILRPTVEEIAAEAGLPVERVSPVLRLPEASSLDAEMNEEGGTLHDLIPADEMGEDDRIARAEIRFRVKSKCAALPLDPRERAILEDRLLASKEEEQTLDQIGQRFDLCRERIRQIEGPLVDKLRVALRPEWDEYSGLAKVGKRRAPSVLQATIQAITEAREPERRPTSPPVTSSAPSRSEYVARVAHLVSSFGWTKAAMQRHAEFIAQAFEWEMEPVQCAMQINRRESEARARKARHASSTCGRAG